MKGTEGNISIDFHTAGFLVEIRAVTSSTLLCRSKTEMHRRTKSDN